MIFSKPKFLIACVLAGVFSVLTGCASVTQGSEQSLRIETLSSEGKPIEGAECQLTNDKGTVTAISGQSTLIRRSAKDLTVHCALAGQAPAIGQAISRINASLAGNAFIGGGIGAAIDVGTGAAYSYTPWMQLVFGEERLFDRNGNRDDGPVAGVLIRTSGPAPSGLAKAGGAAVQPAAPVALEGVRAPLRQGDALEYVLIDQMTGRTASVVYRLDQIAGNEMSFNTGARVEKPDGQVVSIRTPSGGLFETSSPPSGWARANTRLGMTWSEDYPQHKLRATVAGESIYKLDGEDLRVIKIQYTGWLTNTAVGNGTAARASPLEATVLYSPELRRVVRFDAETKAVAGMAKESLQLQRIVRN